MLINHRHKFIFIHIPKCAGGSVHQMLNEQVEGSEAIPGLHTHCTASQVRDVFGASTFGDYYKFAIVRHPIARLKSLYAFGLSRALERQARRRVGLPVKTTTSAENDAAVIERLTRLGEVGWITTYPHHVDVYGKDVKRMCQTEWFEDEGGRLVDDVFKVEALEDMPPVLGQRLGLRLTLPSQRVHVSPNKDARSDAWPEELIDFALTYHRRVFDLYGYDLPPGLAHTKAVR